jgi:hypothetical protein
MPNTTRPRGGLFIELVIGLVVGPVAIRKVENGRWNSTAARLDSYWILIFGIIEFRLQQCIILQGNESALYLVLSRWKSHLHKVLELVCGVAMS